MAFNRKNIGFFVATILIVVSVLWWSLIRIPQSPIVKINDVEIPVEVVRSTEELQRGLSSRVSLGLNSGMLFVLPNKETPNFWMKDMLFPIDIIWIADNKVVGIEQEVQPQLTSPNLQLYKPPRPVDFVLEVNAGFAKKHNINVGNSVILKLR